MTAAAAHAAELWTEAWEALGTTVVVRHAGAPDPAVTAAVRGELAAIDEAASRFRPDSELSRLNALSARGGGTLRTSPLFAEAVRLGIRAAVVSDGAVDPTLGAPLVRLGYDRDWRELDVIPTEAPLGAEVRIVVQERRASRWPEIEVADDPPRVGVPGGVALDLGATAKALAADRAARSAQEAAGGGVLVALGGDIATCGEPPAGGWTIHVTDDHRDGPEAPGQTVSIRSGALATSSIATRRWRHAGRPMHHILDPDSALPVRGPWRTVSVAAETCADANIAATAAMVLGVEAPEWLARHRLPARLVALDGTVHARGDWPR
ncbi:MAG TPA: FAD:protein FMN transferase [Solirubrobacteraceae bacterium]|jgi:thiamine biosynthesis lipoprotein